MRYGHYWIEHANARSTGVALGLCPVLPNERRDGRGWMSVSLARQAVDSDGFDYNNAVGVLLTAEDMARFIHVLNGRAESLCDGKGILYRQASGDAVQLRLWHQASLGECYVMKMSFSKAGTGSSESIFFSFTEVEATVICNLMENSMTKVCFGE